MKLLAFGEIIWDVYPERRVIGGAPLNFAGHCAAGGLDAFMLSAVGEDSLGDDALGMLTEYSVSSKFVLRNSYPTGRCNVTLNESGVPHYDLLTDTAYDNIGDSLTEKIISENFDVLYFGTLAQRGECSRNTLKKLLLSCNFREVFCDLNLRDGGYDAESIKNCLNYATILKFSDEEFPRLSEHGFAMGKSAEDTIKDLFEEYSQIKYILFTKGKDGSAVFTRSREVFNISAVKSNVVSTVGAGDSFGSSWLCRYLAGDSPEKAAEVASRVSGFVVSVRDALPKYEISQFL